MSNGARNVVAEEYTEHTLEFFIYILTAVLVEKHEVYSPKIPAPRKN